MRDDTRWWERVSRWGQVNLSEADAASFDVESWARIWEQMRVHGITVNAGGGGVAYYPSAVPLHRRAAGLGDRDLMGELVQAARDRGLRVLARFDPSSAHTELAQAHPDWFQRTASGELRAAGEGRYATCWNGPFFREYLLAIMSEILDRYEVDGFFTNSWPTLDIAPPVTALEICRCAHCSERWTSITGGSAWPSEADVGDPLWRAYVRSMQDSVLEAMQRLRANVKAARPEAVFAFPTFHSLLTGLPWDRAQELIDFVVHDGQGRYSIFERRASQAPSGAGIWAIGKQSRVVEACTRGRTTFRAAGTYWTGVPGEVPQYRHTIKPAVEQTLHSAETVAHGSSPWWHWTGGTLTDRRWLEPVREYYDWHARHEQHIDRTQSLAEVGIVWSPESLWPSLWAPRAPGASGLDAINGWCRAFTRGRIPYDFVPEWELAREGSHHRVLVLPSRLCIEDAAIEAIREHARQGGGVAGCLDAAMMRHWGEPRPADSLADELGLARNGEVTGRHHHAYQRIAPEVAGRGILADVGNADVIAGGIWLASVAGEAAAQVVCTFVPGYPTHPTDEVYPREPHTSTPTLVQRADDGRVAWCLMDIDAAYARTGMPDLGSLLANAVRWAGGDAPPMLTVTGQGLLDTSVRRTASGLAVHLVNLNTPYSGVGEYADELLPLPEQTVRVRLDVLDVLDRAEQLNVLLLRAGVTPQWLRPTADICEVVVPAVPDFEVLAVTNE